MYVCTWQLSLWVWAVVDLGSGFFWSRDYGAWSVGRRVSFGRWKELVGNTELYEVASGVSLSCRSENVRIASLEAVRLSSPAFF